jgi:hypothetical protein
MLMLWIQDPEDSTRLKLIRHPYSDYQIGMYITFMVLV